MDLKTFRIIKKRKFKRYNKLGQYLKQTVDPYDYCQKKGANRHSKDEINTHLKYKKRYNQSLKKPGKKFYWRDELEFSQYTTETHLKASSPLEYTHYTLKPDSLYLLLGGDIDPLKDIRIQDLKPAIEFLHTLLPSTFWDYGSSEHSLHYYFWVYMGNLYEKVIDHPDNIFFDYNGDHYCYFVNTVKDIISTALQIIILHEFPDIYLENIYPDMSEYDYYLKPVKNKYTCKKTGEVKQTVSYKTIYQELKKNAHMMKLPHPRTDTKLTNLLSLPVTNIEDIILNILRYIQVIDNNMSFTSFPREINDELNDISFFLLNKVQDIFISLSSEESIDLNNLKTAHSEISSLRLEFLRVYKSVTNEENVSGNKTSNNNKLYLLYTYISPRFNVEDENKIFKEIESIPDAYNRSIKFLHYLCWREYTFRQKLPEIEEYIDLYRQFIGTGPEDKNDRKRLEYVYNKGIKLFDSKKVTKKLPYIVGEYTLKLKNEITPEEIIRIRDSKSSYKRPITYEDIDVGAGWIFHSLTNKDYIDEKKNTRKEFTVPANSLVGFHNALNDKGLAQKRGTKGKAKAVREILLHLEWIEVLDEDFCAIEHRAIRYILTAKHPRYNEFVQIIGLSEIEKWRQWKEEKDMDKDRKSA